MNLFCFPVSQALCCCSSGPFYLELFISYSSSQRMHSRKITIPGAVDLYPTFAALAGLPTPESLGEEINGTNLVPVFDDPEASHIALKPAAFSQFAKPFRSKPFEFWPTPARNATQIMGYTVRVDQWRYTSWFGFDGKKVVPKVNEILGRELYDHRGDPGELDWKGEHVNVVDDPTHRDVVASLHSKLLNYIRLYPVQ